jgi:hypothetical protein
MRELAISSLYINTTKKNFAVQRNVDNCPHGQIAKINYY